MAGARRTANIQRLSEEGPLYFRVPSSRKKDKDEDKEKNKSDSGSAVTFEGDGPRPPPGCTLPLRQYSKESPWKERYREDLLSEEEKKSKKIWGFEAEMQWRRKPGNVLAYSRQLHFRMREANPDTLDVDTNLENEFLSAGEDQLANVCVSLNGILNKAALKRPSLNVILLVDTSDSMKGEKMEYAKKAVHQAIDTLHPGDACTVITFGASSQVIIPPFVAGKGAALSKAHSLVGHMEPKGNTDMIAGLKKAADYAQREYTANKVNRIVMITDGRPDKENGLRQFVKLLSADIHTTSMGVGSDFNEDLLMNLADLGRGSYYYIREDDEIEAAVKKELADMEIIVAKDILVHINCREGVYVENVTAFPYSRQGNGVVIDVGDVMAKSKKEILVQLSYSLDSGVHQLVDVEVTYSDNLIQQHRSSSCLTASFNKNVTDLTATAAVGVVVEKIEKVDSARVLREAAAEFKKANTLKANKLLQDVADTLGKRAQFHNLHSLNNLASDIAKLAQEVNYRHQKQQTVTRQMELACKDMAYQLERY